MKRRKEELQNQTITSTKYIYKKERVKNDIENLIEAAKHSSSKVNNF